MSKEKLLSNLFMSKSRYTTLYRHLLLVHNGMGMNVYNERLQLQHALPEYELSGLENRKLLDFFTKFGPKRAELLNRFWSQLVWGIQQSKGWFNQDVIYTDDLLEGRVSEKFTSISSSRLIYYCIENGLFPFYAMDVKSHGERIVKYGEGKGERHVSNKGFQQHRMMFLDMKLLITQSQMVMEAYEQFGMMPLMVLDQSNDGANALWGYPASYEFASRSSLTFSHYLYARNVVHSDSFLQEMKVKKELSFLPREIIEQIEISRNFFPTMIDKAKLMSGLYFQPDEVKLFVKLFEKAFNLNDIKKKCDNLGEQLFGNVFTAERNQDVFNIFKRLELVRQKLDKYASVPGIEDGMSRKKRDELEKAWRLTYTIGKRMFKLTAGSQGNKTTFESRPDHIAILILLNRHVHVSKDVVYVLLRKNGCNPKDITNAIGTWIAKEENENKQICKFTDLIDVLHLMSVNKSISSVKRNKIEKILVTQKVQESL